MVPVVALICKGGESGSRPRKPHRAQQEEEEEKRSLTSFVGTEVVSRSISTASKEVSALPKKRSKAKASGTTITSDEVSAILCSLLSVLIRTHGRASEGKHSQGCMLRSGFFVPCLFVLYSGAMATGATLGRTQRTKTHVVASKRCTDSKGGCTDSKCTEHLVLQGVIVLEHQKKSLAKSRATLDRSSGKSIAPRVACVAAPRKSKKSEKKIGSFGVGVTDGTMNNGGS